jgi:hypothetical protein
MAWAMTAAGTNQTMAAPLLVAMICSKEHDKRN